MAFVTLLTDSGTSDHYVAAIKARILSVNPGLRIIDITHNIAACDLTHAAFTLRSVYNEFPKGTVHLAGVDSVGSRNDKAIAIQLDDHFFVGSDNGLFGLISEKQHQLAVALMGAATPTSFPERDIYAPAAAKLASGVALSSLGAPIQTYKKMIDRSVKATRKQITGHVIRVDRYGNLITNIPKVAFDHLSKDKSYTIAFGGEKFRRIHSQYNHVEEGECVLLFNSLGLLEIGIYKGNASELLGLAYDSVVNIFFDE